jgi:C4-dicarboxylate-binding protein DctP
MKKVMIGLLVPLLVLSLAMGVMSCAKKGPVTPEFTLKLSHTAPVTDTLALQAQKFADLVEEYTGGRVKVDVYPNAMLFTSQTEWEAVATGAVDIVPRYSWYMTTTLPYMLVMALSDIWEGYEHALAFYTSPELTAKITSDLEPLGIHYLGSVPAYMTAVWANSVHEVTTPTDMEGLRRAKGPGTADVPMDVYAGIITVEVPREDMTTALQTGVANLQTTYVNTAVATKIWEVTPHGFVVLSGPMAGTFVMNLDTWDSLPADIQEIITNQVMPDVVQYGYDLMVDSEAQNIATLQANMETLNFESAEDRAALWDTMKDSSVVQGLLNAIGPDVLNIIEATRPSGD